MKKKIFTLLALCLTSVLAAKAADKEVYASIDQSTKTLMFYYDD